MWEAEMVIKVEEGYLLAWVVSIIGLVEHEGRVCFVGPSIIHIV